MLVKVQAVQPYSSGPSEDDLNGRAKRALNEVARKIGRSSVNHLKEMYPEALTAVTKNAEVSGTLSITTCGLCWRLYSTKLQRKAPR